MPALSSACRLRSFPLILSALFLAVVCPLGAAQPTTFGDATPLIWSARLGNSEVARLGTKMAYPAAKWDYANFLFLNSLLGLDARLHQDRYLPWVQGTIDSFLSADGRTIQHYKLEEYNIDHVAPAKAVFTLYKRTGQPARYKGTLDVLREHLKTHPRTKEGGFWHKNRYPHQMWLDGLFMGSPFYAEYGRTFNEPAIFDDVAQQIRLVAKHTYDEKTGLFYHAWDESREQSWANKTTGLSPNFWSRAIGWYAMALVDAYDYFPADHKARAEIAAIFKKLADGVIKYQDPATGVWWQVTDQGNRKGNYLEATASSMFVYSMAKAINQGILPRDAYLPAVIKGYDGIIREFIRTDSTGATKLTRCCKVAGLGFGRDGSFEYYISEPIVDNDAKGTGPFVLAGIELDRLLAINAPASAIPAPAPVAVNLFASTAPASSASSSISPAAAPAASPLLHTFADDASRKAWTEEMPAILARIKAPTFPKREFSIVSYGAPTDGKGDSSEAIRKAIDACHAAGGGVVLIPAGTFHTGAVHLKSNVNLHLDEGAKLLFLTDPKHYPVVFTRWEGVECMNYSPLIYAFEQENIAVTGKGTIDGQADYSNWWGWVKIDANTKPEVPLARASRTRLMKEANDGSLPQNRVYGPGEYLRPPLIQFYRCKNILIEDVTLLRSPFWVINPVLSQNITVRGVTINSHGANSDGCDPESCRDVLIENTKFDTGDDCIAIKSGRNDDGRRIGVPSENIIIRNCEFKDGHGGVVLGSECSGGIRNVFAENCVMDSPNLDRALRFKNNAVRGGILENVHMRNVQIGRVAESVLTIDLLYEEGAKGAHKAVVRNVSMNNIVSTGSPRVMFVRSFPGAEIDDIRIANSTFSGITMTEVLQHTGKITLENVNIIPAKTARAANSVPPPAPAPAAK